MKKLLLLPFFFVSLNCISQKSYKDSIEKFISDYVLRHEVIKGEHKKNLRFYPADEKYRVTATVERKLNSPWFKMESSGPVKMLYRVYATAKFSLGGLKHELHIYQSQALMKMGEYADYLFIPFVDSTTGKETYEGGRYIDLKTGDIKNSRLVIDFNKAYNPYCAYGASYYSCPLPPRENHLKLSLPVGELKYEKASNH